MNGLPKMVRRETGNHLKQLRKTAGGARDWDVFLATGEPKLAIPHFEKAIEHTDIDGYIKSSREGLEQAKQQAGE